MKLNFRVQNIGSLRRTEYSTYNILQFNDTPKNDYYQGYKTQLAFSRFRSSFSNFEHTEVVYSINK